MQATTSAGCSSVLILYGSETGNAQDVAEELWRDARRRQVPARVMAMDDYQIECLPDETQGKVVIFVMATSGQGELPTNARRNWRRLLAKRLPSDHLQRVRVAVMGLGDSSYAQYNYAARKLHRRLTQLGATAVQELGLGDDQHRFGLDAGFEPWRKRLWETLGLELPNEEDELLPPKYRLDYDYADEDGAAEDASTNSYQYQEVEVVANERVTHPDHFQLQDTKLISFSRFTPSSPSTSIDYLPGDVLMVQPRSLDGSVQVAVEALELSDEELDAPFRLVPIDKYVQPPPKWMVQGRTTTLRQCLHVLFDLQAVPKRSLLKRLAQLAAGGEMEAERLRELASAEGLDDYLDYCQRPRRSVAELLRDFPHTAAQLPRERLFDLLPLMRPRAFSIASSPLVHKDVVQLLVARVAYRVKRMASERLGLCSNFLSRLNRGDKVSKMNRGLGGAFAAYWPRCGVKIRPGGIGGYVDCIIQGGDVRLLDCSRLLLVGPGTGVAPCRSIVITNEGRCEQETSAALPVLLFFGCRSETRDYYFRDEWARCRRLRLVCAFSRDQAERRVYVQHRMLEEASEVWRVLSDDKAKILIAGSAGEMPKAVLAVLRQIARDEGGVEDEERYIDELRRCGRIQFETWS